MLLQKGSFTKLLVLVTIISDAYCSSAKKTNPYEDYANNWVPDPRRTRATGFLEPSCIPSRFTDKYETGNCDRPCKPGDHRVCHYVLNVVSGVANDPIACSKKHRNDPFRKCIRTDGVVSSVLTFNHMLPGPTIAVCVGDTICVDVVNHLNNYKLGLSSEALERNMKEDMDIFKVKGGKKQVPRMAKSIWHKHFDPSNFDKKYNSNNHSNYVGVMGASGDLIYYPDYSKPGDSTTVHYHGALQEQTPESDGVPYVTQAPIPHGSYFRSCFKFEHDGSFFYHSHKDLQRSEGMFAVLIVRSPNAPHKNLYDCDKTAHHMILTDMGHNRSHAADSLLMNSHGCFIKPNTTKIVGYVTKYDVDPGLRYYFRFVGNIITSIKITCWIDRHPFTIVAVDGNAIEPIYNVTTFTIANGERVDIILKTNQPVDNYQIHCITSRSPSLHQVAILHYKGAKKPPNCKQVNLKKPLPPGLQFSPENTVPGTPGAITIAETKSVERIKKLCTKKKIFQYHLDMAISSRGLQINNITDEFPAVAMLNALNKDGYINETNICNAHSSLYNAKKCNEKACSCLHVVDLPSCECVEFIIIGGHPFHKHGIRFYVVAEGKDPKNRKVTLDVFRELDKDGLVKRNLVNPPMKDTVAVPAGGYAVIRFVTSNPGYWLAHCHIELHGATGMSMIFRVGKGKDIIRKGFKNHYFQPIKNNLCK